MADFRKICTDYGVSLAKETTIDPTTLSIYWSWDWNTKNGCQDISGKAGLHRFQLQSIASQTKVTFKQLQEWTGLLPFCVRAIPAVPAFIRRWYDASCGLKKCFLKARVTLTLAVVKYMGLIGCICCLKKWKPFNIFSGITYLELVPIAMAFAVWGRELRGKKVFLHTENQALSYRSVIVPLCIFFL